MIKIIKQGKQEFIGKCSQCGCEFSYELSDLQKDIEVYSFDYPDIVKCPCCNEKYIHPFQDIELKEETK